MQEIIVIGGNKGIGKGIVEKFATKNYKIIFSYNSDKKSAVNLKKKLRTKNVTCSYYKLDLSKKISISNFLKKISKNSKELKTIVFNSGAKINRVTFDKVKEKDIRRIFNVNFFGHYLLCQGLYKIIINQKTKYKKNLIFISSEASKFGGKNLTHYAPTKSAINTLVKGLSNELPNDILVNAISPGIIMTEGMRKANKIDEKKINLINKTIPLGRVGKPEEVANIIFFLSEKNNNLFTGQIFSVNGAR